MHRRDWSCLVNSWAYLSSNAAWQVIAVQRWETAGSKQLGFRGDGGELTASEQGLLLWVYLCNVEKAWKRSSACKGKKEAELAPCKSWILALCRQGTLCKPSFWSSQETGWGYPPLCGDNSLPQHAVSSFWLLESCLPFQIPGLCNGFWAQQTELETETGASCKTACWLSLESHLASWALGVYATSLKLSCCCGFVFFF